MSLSTAELPIRIARHDNLAARHGGMFAQFHAQAVAAPKPVRARLAKMLWPERGQAAYAPAMTACGDAREEKATREAAQTWSQRP